LGNISNFTEFNGYAQSHPVNIKSNHDNTSIITKSDTLPTTKAIKSIKPQKHVKSMTLTVNVIPSKVLKSELKLPKQIKSMTKTESEPAKSKTVSKVKPMMTIQSKVQSKVSTVKPLIIIPSKVTKLTSNSSATKSNTHTVNMPKPIDLKAEQSASLLSSSHNFSLNIGTKTNTGIKLAGLSDEPPNLNQQVSYSLTERLKTNINNLKYKLSKLKQKIDRSHSHKNIEYQNKIDQARLITKETFIDIVHRTVNVLVKLNAQSLTRFMETQEFQRWYEKHGQKLAPI